MWATAMATVVFAHVLAHVNTTAHMSGHTSTHATILAIALFRDDGPALIGPTLTRLHTALLRTHTLSR